MSAASIWGEWGQPVVPAPSAEAVAQRAAAKARRARRSAGARALVRKYGPETARRITGKHLQA